MTTVFTDASGFVRFRGALSPVFATATLHLSSAQLLACHASPPQLLPTPGAGKTYLILAATAIYNAGATPYVCPGDLNVFYGSDVDTGQTPIQFATGTGFMDGAVDFAVSPPLRLVRGITAVLYDIEMRVGMDSADPTDGDGTVDVSVTYTIGVAPG